MDLAQFRPLFLFLHVIGAILAFGPTYAFSIMGTMAGKEPQHANFSARQAEVICNMLVYPLAIFQGITGVLLIMRAGDPPSEAAVARGRHHPVPHRDHLRADGPAQRPASPHRDHLDAAAARHAARPAAARAPRDGQEDPARRHVPRRS